MATELACTLAAGSRTQMANFIPSSLECDLPKSFEAKTSLVLPGSQSNTVLQVEGGAGRGKAV